MLLFFLRVSLLVLGVVLCLVLFSLVRQDLKTDQGMLLITVPATLALVVVVIDDSCRVFHLPRAVIPDQVAISHAIGVFCEFAAVPLLLMKLYQWGRARRPKRRESEDNM